jgi:hypothetical protein
LTGSTTFTDDKWFDHHYFYRDEHHKCHYTCGLARAAGATVVRESQPGQFISDVWLNSLDSHVSNPSVVGFTVEQACISAITERGFHHGGLNWERPATVVYHGDIFITLPTATSETFFVPANPNFKNIDAVFIRLNTAKKEVLVVPIQITINKKHKDSEALFYYDWSRWKKHYEEYTISSVFVWVVEHKRSWSVIEEKLRATKRGPRLVTPEHTRNVITVGELYAPLGRRLEVVRRATRGKKRPREELPMISHEGRPPTGKKVDVEVDKSTHALTASSSRKPGSGRASISSTRSKVSAGATVDKEGSSGLRRSTRKKK